MDCIKGKAISKGIAIGKVFVYEEPEIKISPKKTAEVKKELQRFSDARRAVRKQLVEMQRKTESDIIAAHIAVVDDVIFEEMVEGYIKKNATAECAVLLVRNELCKTFDTMEDEYLKEKSLDIKDVGNKIIRRLAGINDKIKLAEPIILMTEELTPTQTFNLDRNNLLGFVTTNGGANSHTAILARESAIPAVSGVGVDKSLDGKLVLIDGYEGNVYIEPSEEFIDEMLKKYNQSTGFNWAAVENRPKIYANISSALDARKALENGAEGIGLFRTEFMYLGRTDYPSQEEQFSEYKEIAQLFKDKPVVIRMVDFGADKKTEYLGLPCEVNPALGYRGIRVLLDRQDVFKEQLKAVLRAAVFGNIYIMLPMITSLDEVVQAKKIIEKIKKQLKKEGVEYGEAKLGIMIETPAAVMISDELAKAVDFFSIGTNDLTQYTLAMDRQNSMITEYYNVHHKAVLKMIKLVVDNGHKKGIQVGICGELAADATLANEFVKMKVDALSMPIVQKIL